jgi:hypothetical protein
MFGDVQGKVKKLGEKFPVIRGLLGKFYCFEFAPFLILYFTLENSAGKEIEVFLSCY